MYRKQITVILLLVLLTLLPSCMPAQGRPVSGQTEAVNGIVKNLSPVGLKVFGYDAGKFTLLDEQSSELIYSDSGTVRKLSLSYYTDKEDGVVISSLLHADDITDMADIDLREALPVSDTFEVLYAVASLSSRVLLAVNANGTADTLLADLNTGLVAPLIPSDKLLAPKAEEGLCVTRAVPLLLSPDGGRVLLLSGPSGGMYSLMSWDFTSGQLSAFGGASVREGELQDCDIRWLDGERIAISRSDSGGALEVYSLASGAEGEAVSAMAVSSPRVSYTGSYAAGWSFEQNGGTLTLTRLSDSFTVSAQTQLSAEDFTLKNAAFNPSESRCAIYSKGIIYIINLMDGSVSSINAEEKYQSVYETARPFCWLDDEVLLFNSGTTDSGGQLSVTPVIIK
ncbi:MAG: hypothetical protein AB9835_11320 [Eubacteriales bacterium]